MIFEMVGLPGAGKTTIQKQCNIFSKRNKLRVANAEKLLRLDSENPEISGYVRRNSVARILYRHEKTLRDQFELIEEIRILHRDKINALCLFLNSIYLQQIYRENSDQFDAYFVDEGPVHRSVYAAIKIAERDYDTLDSLLPKMPLPDLLIYLNPPPELAYQRVIERLAQRSGEAPTSQNTLDRINSAHGDLDAFKERGDILEAAAETIENLGTKVLTLNTDNDPKLVKQEIEETLKKSLT